MKKKFGVMVLGTAMALFAVAPAMAAPADGQCVSNGVKALGGATISAAARGGVLEGLNAVPIVINDHLRNGADVTEGIVGVTICD